MKPASRQLEAYESAYSGAVPVPFPDHKIENTQGLTGKVIVSVGGGVGSDVAHLAVGNEVFVIDYSEASGKVAQQFGLKPLVMDLNHSDIRFPFPDQSVDVLVVKDLFEHLLDPMALMPELKRVLRHDGYMVVSIPNHLTAWGRLRLLFGSNLIWKGMLHDHSKDYNEWDYMHVRFFTWSGFNRFLSKAGLKVDRAFLDFGPFGHYLSIPMYAEHLMIKQLRGVLTQKGRWFLRIAYPAYLLVDLVFPARFRNWVCGLRPSLLTSCFYVHAKKV